MSIKAYKYRIYANKATTDKLQWTLDRCRELYNAGVQERREEAGGAGAQEGSYAQGLQQRAARRVKFVREARA